MARPWPEEIGSPPCPLPFFLSFPPKHTNLGGLAVVADNLVEVVEALVIAARQSEHATLPEDLVVPRLVAIHHRQRVIALR